MARVWLIAAVALAGLMASPSLAAQCKGSDGKWIACPKPPVTHAKCTDAPGTFNHCPAVKTATPATAARAVQCKDAKGKFIKCSTAPSAMAASTRCKDAGGKFAKCGTPGAKPY